MPGNSTGWFWHSLARETGKLGHLFSPGAQRGPWPWFPYALDNGCFALWNPESNTFDEAGWILTGESAWKRLLFWAQCVNADPRWVIVPDRPGDAGETIRKWGEYAQLVQSLGFPLALAAQDGMEPSTINALLDPRPDVVCIGGSTEWKWENVERWTHHFSRVHLLRCNSPSRLAWLESIGVESCDGTGWNRGDVNQTRGLEEWARGPVPTRWTLWPHVCRQTKKSERPMKGQPVQESFA